MRVILQVRDEDVMISESALNLMLAFEAKLGASGASAQKQRLIHIMALAAECIRHVRPSLRVRRDPPRFEVECPSGSVRSPDLPGDGGCCGCRRKRIRTCHDTSSPLGAGWIDGEP